jgi:hypothetical protein
MASEKINEINEKIESGREAVKGAISWLKNLMTKNSKTQGELIWWWFKNLIQSSSRNENDSKAAQASLSKAFGG